MNTVKYIIEVVNAPGDMEENIDWTQKYDGSKSKMQFTTEKHTLLDNTSRKNKPCESYAIYILDVSKINKI